MPCKHAVATIWNMQQNSEQVALPEHFMHEVYWLTTWQEMYKFKINPILGPPQWPKSSCPFTITPPNHHIQVGRPKKKRVKSVGEVDEGLAKATKLPRLGKSVTCDKCKKQGHNSRTCKGQSSGMSSSQQGGMASIKATTKTAGKKSSKK